MADLRSLGLGATGRVPAAEQATEYVVVHRPLQRVLAFTRLSIHDVINNPIARNKVRCYYKLLKDVQRACEVVDLERWWNRSP